MDGGSCKIQRQIPVYNMQCDIWHPTQAVADLFTIREKFGRDLRKKKFVISWTSAPNYIRPLSMANNLVEIMTRTGMDVTLAHPEKFDLMPEALQMAKDNAEAQGSKFEVVFHDMDEAGKDADVIYAKGWGPIMYTGDNDEAGLKLIDENPGWIVDQRKNGTRQEKCNLHALYACRQRY